MIVAQQDMRKVTGSGTRPVDAMLRHGSGPRINYAGLMPNEGFAILHNGVPRTFRDKRETAYEAARFAKTRAGRPLSLLLLLTVREQSQTTGKVG